MNTAKLLRRTFTLGLLFLAGCVTTSVALKPGINPEHHSKEQIPIYTGLHFQRSSIERMMNGQTLPLSQLPKNIEIGTVTFSASTMAKWPGLFEKARTEARKVGADGLVLRTSHSEVLFYYDEAHKRFPEYGPGLIVFAIVRFVNKAP
jgi:hypothetical protein